MYENSTTYTWWDIEGGVGPLAIQAADRWEALDLPKGTAENPMVLRVWVTSTGGVVYTITLLHRDVEVYTAEGEIKISGVPPRAVAVAAESAIFESAADIVGENAASRLVEGLLSWLNRQ